ncbi:ribosome modulation factor [Ralstonia nicotianae]
MLSTRLGTRETIMQRVDKVAWRAGFDAGQAGQPRVCPYFGDSVRALSWAMGYAEGRSCRVWTRASRPGVWGH